MLMPEHVDLEAEDAATWSVMRLGEQLQKVVDFDNSGRTELSNT